MERAVLVSVRHLRVGQLGTRLEHLAHMRQISGAHILRETGLMTAHLIIRISRSLSVASRILSKAPSGSPFNRSLQSVATGNRRRERARIETEPLRKLVDDAPASSSRFTPPSVFADTQDCAWYRLPHCP